MKKALAGLLGLAGVAWALKDVPRQLGGKPDPVHMSRSPRFRDGKFHNDKEVRTVPDRDSFSIRDFVRGGQDRKPAVAVPLVGPATPVDRRTAHHLVRPLVRADRDRRPPGAARPGVERPLSRRPRLVGPKRLHESPHRAARSARRSTRW